ncbi:MAG: hypothetical protein WKF47_19195 [Geodermatophilaceae bacterium]
MVTGRASVLSGYADRALRPLLHQVEGVEARPQLVAHQQIGEGLVLGSRASLELLGIDTAAGVFEQLQCPVGRRCSAVELGVHRGPVREPLLLSTRPRGRSRDA